MCSNIGNVAYPTGINRCWVKLSIKQLWCFIAQSWLEDSDSFSIPKLTFVERWGKARIVALSSFVVIVPIMTWLIFHYRKEHPDIVGIFLGLEPLLALPGAIASWLVYEIVMKVWK